VTGRAIVLGQATAWHLFLPMLGEYLVILLTLPFIASGAFPLVWVIWAILLIAELGSLLMHWDLQRRLAKRGIVV